MRVWLMLLVLAMALAPTSACSLVLNGDGDGDGDWTPWQDYDLTPNDLDDTDIVFPPTFNGPCRLVTDPDAGADSCGFAVTGFVSIIDGIEVAVLAGKTIHIPSDSQVEAVGPRPLVLIANDITIDGLLDVGSRVGVPQLANSGPGARTLSLCSTGVLPGDAPGLGGGSASSQGQPGGPSFNDVIPGGTAEPAIMPSDLHAGCPGAGGASGGGAVHLLAFNQLSISGNVSSGGAGGVAGGGTRGGGGGGGAGGMIILDSPMLTIVGALAANGGGGGGGQGFEGADVPGNPGEDGFVGEMGGAGGDGGGPNGGPGGNGVGNVGGSAGSAPTMGPDSNGGGGGGGSQGWIFHNTVEGGGESIPSSPVAEPLFPPP